jgi:hypothetical protein
MHQRSGLRGGRAEGYLTQRGCATITMRKKALGLFVRQTVSIDAGGEPGVASLLRSCGHGSSQFCFLFSA